LWDSPEPPPFTREEWDDAQKRACAADPTTCALAYALPFAVVGGVALEGATGVGAATARGAAALARDPRVQINAWEFGLEGRRGYSRGRKLLPPARPLGTSPGGWAGYYSGYAVGLGKRAAGAIGDVFDDFLGP